MKLVMKPKDIKGQICELIRLRAQDERKRSKSAKTQREEAAHERAFRVLGDLYTDLSNALIEEDRDVTS